MKKWATVAIGLTVTSGFVASHVACDREVPAEPTRIADSPVTTLSGTRYSGTIVINGETRTFNMTLIARALGLAARRTHLAQLPNTVEVTGQFEVVPGAGSSSPDISGSVQGALQGTLENGVFDGSLVSAATATGGASCERGYVGPVGSSGVLWTPAGASVPNCPLTFPVQVPRTDNPPCSYSLAATQTSFPAIGGKAVLSVTTGNGCIWRPESFATWIVLADTIARVGTGNVAFSVLQHTAFTQRQGQLGLANQQLSISQAAAVPPTGSVTLGVSGSGTVRLPADPLLPQIASCQTSSCPAVSVAAGTVTIGATPNGGWTFNNWTGACASQQTPTCTITVQSGQTVSGTAVFVQIPIIN